MPDGKRRLPLYTEPSGFDAKEVLALHFNKPLFFTADCFTDHSEDKNAVRYHFQGLKALNQGYWSADTEERQQYFKNENKKSDSHYVCHLMHQGFYNASDLKRLEDSFKEGRK